MPTLISWTHVSENACLNNARTLHQWVRILICGSAPNHCGGAPDFAGDRMWYQGLINILFLNSCKKNNCRNIQGGQIKWLCTHKMHIQLCVRWYTDFPFNCCEPGKSVEPEPCSSMTKQPFTIYISSPKRLETPHAFFQHWS